MSKLKPNKQAVGFCVNAAACLLAIAAGLSYVHMALSCGIVVGLALSVFALLAQALVSALTTPYIRRKSRPLLWMTAGEALTSVVGYIAVDLCHAPVMEGGKYVGMGVALIVFQSVSLALVLSLAVYCVIVTLRKSSEQAPAQDVQPQAVDTDQLVAQAQDVVLKSKIAVEDAPAPERITRRAVSPEMARAERKAPPVTYVEESTEGVYQPAHSEEAFEPPKAVELSPSFEEEEPVADIPEAIFEPTPEPVAEADLSPASFEEDVVIFAAHGAVDAADGTPLHDSDIRAEYATHHPRQKPHAEDDAIYTDFGYGED